MPASELAVTMGPMLATGGVTGLAALWAGRHGRRAEAARADAEADRIRTETYGDIIGDLRSELDRVRGALQDAGKRVEALTRDLADAHAALGEIGVWARDMRSWGDAQARKLVEAGSSVDPVPVLRHLDTRRRDG